jgi:hypothetical protein
MRCKDAKDAQKILAKIPTPWVPGYWAMMRGTQKRRDRLANQSQAAKK